MSDEEEVVGFRFSVLSLASSLVPRPSSLHLPNDRTTHTATDTTAEMTRQVTSGK